MSCMLYTSTSKQHDEAGPAPTPHFTDEETEALQSPESKQWSLDSEGTLQSPPPVAERTWATPMLSVPVNGHILNELVGEVVSQDNSPWRHLESYLLQLLPTGLGLGDTWGSEEPACLT
jgi:hypothetical protein